MPANARTNSGCCHAFACNGDPSISQSFGYSKCDKRALLYPYLDCGMRSFEIMVSLPDQARSLWFLRVQPTSILRGDFADVVLG
jgi:hypothetical protein